jgi:sulfur relay (sulfurtransferase) DsrF/TusC family protein
MKKNKTKEIKYYELDGRKYFFSDKNLAKNSEDHSIVFNDGEQTKRISLLYASTDYFVCSNLLEKLGVTSEELEQEFPKARRALFLYEIEAINNDNESENMEKNNEVS